MHFLLFDFVQLALLDHLQTFLEIFQPVQFLIDDQLGYGLHPALALLLLVLAGRLLQPQLHFLLPDGHELRVVVILAVNMLLKVLDPGHVDAVLEVAIPLLILDDVVCADVEALESRLLVLHDRLHHPAEVLLVLRFADAEALQRILAQVLGEDQQRQPAQLDRPRLPLADHRFLDIETRLSIMQLPQRSPFDSAVKQLDPPEVNTDLLLSPLLADLLPVIRKILAGLLHALAVLELLVALANVVLHVGELREGAGLRGFCGRDLDELVENAGHLICYQSLSSPHIGPLSAQNTPHRPAFPTPPRKPHHILIRLRLSRIKTWGCCLMWIIN